MLARKSTMESDTTALSEGERTALLARYGKGSVSASELRRALGGISYGDVLIELARRGLPLPRAPQTGRERRIATARAWLFPEMA
jgi:hypothetical protein